MNTPVIDFHAHLGNWGRHAMHGDLERYVDMMDRAGIDKACVNCIFLGDARAANDLVADFVARRPDRFIPVAFVTPHYPDEALSELERARGAPVRRSRGHRAVETPAGPSRHPGAPPGHAGVGTPYRRGPPLP